jgi:histidine ammonia-lyase
VRASRAVVDDALASGEPSYGLNTGVGHRKDERLSDDELRRLQDVLVTTHAGGIGPPLPTEVVRAALMVRLNGIVRGGSGASPAVADVLAAMLNAGVHPVVPETGSVGTGDLSQLATMALVATGRGWAKVGAEVLSAREALGRVDIEPLVLQPKDGLAFMSSNAISIGHAALVCAQAVEAATVADVVAALSLEAIGGNPSIIQPVVAQAKPFPGQVEACDSMRAALKGSYLFEPGAPSSIQDPLSFRVAPQVHGALREFIVFARRAVEIELNGLSDNPLVSVEDRTMVHNGNFDPLSMAIAFDALRVALAHVGQLSDRRMNHLWKAFFASMGQAGPAPEGAVPKLFGLSLRYPAAALFAELRQLAAPATLDVSPLDLEVEDHATSAPLGVRKSDEAVRLLEDILAVELLLARDVLTAMPSRGALGVGTGSALDLVEKTLAGTDERSPASVHLAVRERLSQLSVRSSLST